MSFHQLDLRGFFSFVDSELLVALFFGHMVNFNRFGNFYKYEIKLGKNQFWPLKMCFPHYIFVVFLYVM